MRSEQEWLEISNQVLDNLGRSEQTFQDRLTLENLRLSERYVKGELNILIGFKVPLDRKDWIALFRAKQVTTAEIKPCGSLAEWTTQPNIMREQSFQSPASDFDANLTDVNGSGYQESVLIDVVKLIESPDCVVGSHVRLGSPQYIFDSLNNGSLYFSIRFGHVLFETLKVVENGESRSIFGVGLSTDTHLNKLPPEIVERTSQVVDGISEWKQNRIGDFFPPVEEKDRDVIFRVILGSSCIWIRSQECGPCAIQLTDVLFGPFDFGRRTADVAGQGHLPHSGK